MKSYCNLHQHTIYSFLDGLAKLNLLAERAAELGMSALGITDHGNIHGWLPFLDACLKAGVKPVFGEEFYQARKTRRDRDDEERAGKAIDDLEQRGPYHLTVLARNLQGYKNIIKLSSRAFTEGFYVKPRIDHELIAEHSDGLIVLSGCLNGEVQRALLRGDYEFALNAAGRMQDMVGRDHYFIEIQDHGIDEQKRIAQQTIEIAKTLRAPLVPTGDCHYVYKEEAHAHDVMLCVSTGATIDQEKRFRFAGPEFYLKSYEEMATRFPDEWLKNTLLIAEMVDVDLKFGDLYFPDFPIDTGESVDQMLDRLVWTGVKERYGDPAPIEVIERTEHELKVVKKMGFQSYFLVVSDLVNWAKDNGIRVGWGRGSAAGSILSYVLRITNLEPLRFGLLFERFLVEGRKSMPDIDLDFDSRFRDRVIDYARSKYGNDRVAHICTFSQVKAKAAIKDAGKVLGYDFQMRNAINKLMPPAVQGVTKTLDEALKTEDLAFKYESDSDVRKIVDAAKGLEGIFRQPGIHAAGVVIAQAPVTEFVPIMKKPNKDGTEGPVVTQWGMEDIERCGQLKIDFLAIANLDVVDICINSIKETHGFELNVDDIPLDDELTYQQLKLGHATGVFQLESSGMRETIVSMQPSSIEDIMAIISLYRPGPMGSGMDKMYVARKHGRSEVKFDHPKLANVLAASYGVMLYQEDVLAVARNLAGFSVAEADDLRKVIGKKQVDKIPLYREKFVEGCVKNDVDKAVADKIYSDIEYFGGYGFPRAHAAAYGILSYVTAYLKFNYPAEYMAALLTVMADDRDKAAIYLNECRRLGLTVLPPSINKSEANFKVLSEKEILFGLSSISGLGPAIVNYIIDGRGEDYYSMYDFMRRCNPEVLNKLTLEHLMKSGAFDELAPSQPEQLLSREAKMELLDLEKQELGLYVSDHPLLGVWHLIESSIDTTIEDLEQASNGEPVVLGGLLTQANRRLTKKNDVMYNLVLEDMTGSIGVLVFPKDAAKNEFVEGDIVILEGRVQKEGDEEYSSTKVIFSNMDKPMLPEYGVGQPIVLRFPQSPSRGIIREIENLIEEATGNSPVYVEYLEDTHLVSLRFKKPTSLGIKENLELLTLKERMYV
jgi:DNA polymerase-3 subunit alpha